MTFGPDRQKFIKTIHEAFPLEPLPRGSDLTRSSFAIDLEREAIHRFLEGRKWDDVSLEVINSKYPGDGSAILALVADTAFRYYFPAFLTIAILDPEEGLQLSRAAIYAFTLSKGRHSRLREHQLRRCSSFSTAQLATIRDIFMHLQAEEPDCYPPWEISPALETIQSILRERSVFVSAED